MSYIDSTRKSYSSPYEITVCMAKEECKILLPFFQKAYKSVKSKYEKYNDIHNGGEATEREEYFCIDCAKQLECWGPDIKLDDPDLYIPINCIDYQEMDEFFNL